MQDYNYIWGGCMEITLELSCCKYPSRQELPRYWRENKKSLLLYLGEIHRGIKGLVLDINGNVIPKALMKIKGRDISFKSSKRGEFWRILLPGIYTIVVSADGYQNLSQKFSVEEGRITLLNVQLVPIGFVSNPSLLNSPLTQTFINTSVNMSAINPNQKDSERKHKALTKDKSISLTNPTTVRTNEVFFKQENKMFAWSSNKAIIFGFNSFHVISSLLFYLSIEFFA